jgi:hypothetical protein
LQIFTLLLLPYATTKAATVFALGAVYGRSDIIVEGLQHYEDETMTTDPRLVWIFGKTDFTKGYDASGSKAFVTLEEVPVELRQRIPLTIMWKYLDLQNLIVVQGTGTWRKLLSRLSWDVCFYLLSSDFVAHLLISSRETSVFSSHKDGSYGFRR